MRSKIRQAIPKTFYRGRRDLCREAEKEGPPLRKPESRNQGWGSAAELTSSSTSTREMIRSGRREVTS